MEFFVSFFNRLSSSCFGMGLLPWATELINSPFFDLTLALVMLFTFPVIICLSQINFTKPIFNKMYGSFTQDELRKFFILAITLMLIIGGYWGFKNLKDGYFMDLVGVDYMPRLKIISLLFFSVAILLFTSIVDRFKKHHLFFVVGLVYSIMFGSIALLDWLQLPEATIFPLSLIPGRVSAWLLYLTVDSLGGILIGAVFWAFVNSTTTSDIAKKGFPLIFIGGQIGGVLGTTFVKSFVTKLGYPATILGLTIPFVLLPILMEILILTTPTELMLSDQHVAVDEQLPVTKKPAGLFEGLRLIATHPYLIGIAIISTIYEVITTIIEFQFRKAATLVYSKEALTSFLASQGQITNMLSLLMVLIGTSFVVRILGVRVALFLYPSLAAIIVLLVFINPCLSWFFFAVVAIKASSYALNGPIRELLYVPTSKDIKFKAKGFIDGLGTKVSKASGMSINQAALSLSGGSTIAILNTGSAVSLAIILFWLLVATLVGKTYQNLIKKNQIIE